MFHHPVRLCTRRSCCPTVEYDSTLDAYIIRDDFGGKVRLLKEEIEKLWETISEVQDEEQDSST